MRIKFASVTGRLGFAIVACMIFLVSLQVLEQVTNHVARDRAQERLMVNLQGQISSLQEDQERLETENEQQLKVAIQWLSKTTIPREKILKIARLDAVEGTQIDVEVCYANATLESDGWNVSCGYELSLFEPRYIQYVIDPLTGKILSKRTVKKIDVEP